MTDRDDFLAWVKSTLHEAEFALHNGDAAPRRALWSRNEPVSILGAARNAYGQDEVDEAFAWLERRFSDCTSYSFEVQAYDVVGDMAYTAGLEHTSASMEASRAVTPCGQPRCIAARAANGRWPISMPTPCPIDVANSKWTMDATSRLPP
jgi:ketosteroid isomerase-like protein